MDNKNDSYLYLNRLGPGIREIRIFGKGAPLTMFYDDINAAVQTIADYKGKAQVYVTINPVKVGTQGKHPLNQLFASNTGEATSDADIANIDRLLIDLDTIRAKDREKESATDDEKAKCHDVLIAVGQWLKEQGITPDNYTVEDSGNGYHIDLCTDLPNNPANIALCKELLNIINRLFGNENCDPDTTTFNPSRITKPAGSMAIKGPNTADRPWRDSKTLYAPDQLVPVERYVLEYIVSLYANKQETDRKVYQGATGGGKFDLDAFIEKWNLKVISRGAYQDGDKIKIECPLGNEHSTDDKTAYLYYSKAGIPGYNCFHKSHNAMTFSDLHERLEPGYKDKWKQHVYSGSDSGNGHMPMFPLTDAGNAERLYYRYGADFRYVVQRKKFICWNGVNAWQYDNDEDTHMMKLAKDTIRNIVNEPDPPGDKGFDLKIKWALSSENGNHARQMIDRAKSEGNTAISILELDADDYLFNCQNATIDLRTGLGRPADKKDLITIVAPVTYDPAAKCPLWDAFLDMIMAGSKPKIKFLQTLHGYGITGSTITDVVPFYHGYGGNGKSTFLGTVRDKIMGEYAKEVDPEVFMANKQRFRDSGIREQIADMYGKRLITATELPPGELNTRFMKAVSGGEGVSGDRKYENTITYKPKYKVILTGNEEPTITDPTDATWRRLKKTPFTIKIEDAVGGKLNVIDGYEERFNPELSGILNWLIEGCLIWQKEGLIDPQEVIDATNEYRSTQDAIGMFIKENYEYGTGAGYSVMQKTFYADLITYWDEYGITYMKKGDVKKRMIAGGKVTIGRGTGNMATYEGIRRLPKPTEPLKSQPEPTQAPLEAEHRSEQDPYYQGDYPDFKCPNLDCDSTANDWRFDEKGHYICRNGHVLLQ